MHANLKRKRMHDDKVPYKTKAEARQARHDAQKANGGLWDWYKCPYCDGYHIGHTIGTKNLEALNAE